MATIQSATLVLLVVLPSTTQSMKYLHNAIQENNIHAVTTLLKAGANPNSKCILFSNTPLHIAIEQGNYEIIQTLLRFRANPHESNKVGNTPLHTALNQDQFIFNLRNKRKRIVKLLLRYSADPLVYDNDNNTILSIIRKEYIRALQDTQKWHIYAITNLVRVHEIEAQEYKKIARLLIARIGLYTKHGRIAHRGLAQVLPLELVYHIASYFY